MEYHDKDEKYIGNRLAVCRYFVKVHHEACHEADEVRFATLCQQFGVTEYVAPVQPEPSQADIFAQAQAALTMTIQQHLDSVAQTRNYDSILSLCTYVTSTDSIFAAEGQAGVIWRDACWRKGYEVLTAVTQGLRPIPTEAELLAEMPVIGW